MGVEKLQADRSIKVLELDFAEERWVFKYIRPTWGELLSAIAGSGSYDTGGQYHFDSPVYYSRMLMTMLREAPEGFVISETYLSTLDPEVGLKLMSIVPSPQSSLGESSKKA